MAKCKKLGIDVPTVYRTDDSKRQIIMEFVNGCTVRDFVFSLDLDKSAGVLACSAAR